MGRQKGKFFFWLQQYVNKKIGNRKLSFCKGGLRSGCGGEFQVPLGDRQWKILVQYVKVGRTLKEMILSFVLPLTLQCSQKDSLAPFSKKGFEECWNDDLNKISNGIMQQTCISSLHLYEFDTNEMAVPVDQNGQYQQVHVLNLKS